ncbi:prion-inhibition and propagation-domain-containing protein [Podospora didyma]|uniref:Prion-inhibition and propagation-domain-containing protein n=1 Tax=Podospora didyma TaxID=330526 RepID=A0AAE0NSM1_9PEZI|nr:prion-inhibition and propagation-domain-containing protein [Podospora didyma]
MEIAGFVIGTFGLAGLFKSCIENFDIVVRARDFSEEFDLLCTQLSVQQVRLLLWGESLGLFPNQGRRVRYHAGLNRPAIRRAVESSLNHLKNLLSKADVIVGRYDTDEAEAGAGAGAGALQVVEPASHGMVIFKNTFQKFKSRLRTNQKATSTWKVTRWSVHDYEKFRHFVTNIKDLIDGLESITASLGLLDRQRESLVEEVATISDTESLRLLVALGSDVSAPPSLKAVSDTASLKISSITTGSSFHTAPTHISTHLSSPTGRRSLIAQMSATLPAQGVETTSQKTWDARGKQHGALDLRDAPVAEQASSSMQASAAEVPQNQRWMAALIKQQPPTPREQDFTTGEDSYGAKLESIKESDDKTWAGISAKILSEAHGGRSLAQRVFLELRSIRKANVPFISATPVGDSVDKLLASIEGPPGTPYEGGVFWFTVRLVDGRPPMLRFQTRIYHPNIDCTGKLCANYEEWWTNKSLQGFLGPAEQDDDLPWFSERKANHYSLGILLVAICGLLASPNIDDPLVPEIAEKYITDYDGFFQSAQVYTQKYAQGSPPKEEDLIFANDDTNPASLMPLDLKNARKKTVAPSMAGQVSLRRQPMLETWGAETVTSAFYPHSSRMRTDITEANLWDRQSTLQIEVESTIATSRRALIFRKASASVEAAVHKTVTRLEWELIVWTDILKLLRSLITHLDRDLIRYPLRLASSLSLSIEALLRGDLATPDPDSLCRTLRIDIDIIIRFMTEWRIFEDYPTASWNNLGQVLYHDSDTTVPFPFLSHAWVRPRKGDWSWLSASSMRLNFLQLFAFVRENRTEVGVMSSGSGLRGGET